MEMRASRKLLATIEIPDYYIRQGETRPLRSYQKEAMRVLDRALELGSRRMPPFHLWRMADRTHPLDALHIGLTATPSVYIERNTFRFYQCKDDTPDFAYPIQDAFKEGYL
ncbi:MAG TPA: hypothetical protein VE965_03110, partial [Gammaproteobacteria bacterium]|nr:hypothetical protein [Gammaproteobacteria bacterium]